MIDSNNTIRQFIQFVNSITTRPGMYQVCNVQDLNLIIMGYSAASEEEVSQLLLRFREFVNNKFNSDSDYDWARLLLFHAGDNLASIKLFELRFKEFLSDYLRN